MSRPTSSSRGTAVPGTRMPGHWPNHNRASAAGGAAGRAGGPAEVGGGEEGGVPAELGGGAAGGQLAVGQDVAAVGDLQGQVNVLLHQEHPAPGAGGGLAATP